MSNISVFNAAGEKQDAVLNFDIVLPEKEASQKSFACAVRVLLQNWRQGTVASKSRGQVAFSNKKPWKQKGTGRARAGSLRSPLWRKGGVIFGPQARTRMLKLNRKQRRFGLVTLLRDMLADGRVFCFDADIKKDTTPKTKEVYKSLGAMGLHEKKGILFLPYDDVVTFASFRNIPQVSVFSFDQPNAFDLSSMNYWMFLKRDLKLFKEMVEKWT